MLSTDAPRVFMCGRGRFGGESGGLRVRVLLPLHRRTRPLMSRTGVRSVWSQGRIAGMLVACAAVWQATPASASIVSDPFTDGNLDQVGTSDPQGIPWFAVSPANNSATLGVANDPTLGSGN